MLRNTLTSFFAAYVPAGASVSLPVRAPSSLAEGTATFRRTESAAYRQSHNRKGFFYLPKVEYPTQNGISPVMSQRQFSFIRDVHHSDVVNTLNSFALGSQYEGQPLEAVVKSTAFDAMNSVVHTAASEHFNNSFFYLSMRPFGVPIPPLISELLDAQFGSSTNSSDMNNNSANDDSGNSGFLQNLEKILVHSALSHQSQSGWLFLLWTGTEMAVVVYSHGTCPLSGSHVPLLVMNLHEHAYSLDYGTGPDALTKYVKNCLKAWNWNLCLRYIQLATGRKHLELMNFN